MGNDILEDRTQYNPPTPLLAPTYVSEGRSTGQLSPHGQAEDMDSL